MPGRGGGHRRDRGIRARGASRRGMSVAAKAGSDRCQGWRVDDHHQRRSSCCRRSAAGSGCAPPPTRDPSPPNRRPKAPSPRGARRRRRPTASTTQASTTARMCVPAKRPRRPIGPTALIARPPARDGTPYAERRGWAVADEHEQPLADANEGRQQQEPRADQDGQQHADQRDGAGHREQHQLERLAPGCAWVGLISRHRELLGLERWARVAPRARRRSRKAIRRRFRRARTRSGRRSRKGRGCPLATLDEAGRVKDVEMSGDVLLAGAERLGQFSDRCLAGRSRSSSLRRIGSPITRKRAAITSTSGSGSGSEIDVRGSMLVIIVLLYQSVRVHANSGRMMKNAQALVHGVTAYGSASGGVDR